MADLDGDDGIVVRRIMSGCRPKSDNHLKGRNHMYESPTITELGSVADFTRAAGPGDGIDASFAGVVEFFTGWDKSHAPTS